MLGATPVQLQLSCSLMVAAGRQVPAVVAAATAALSDPAQGVFSPAGMGIGQRLYRSAIDAALMVPGVTAVRNLTVTRTGPPLAPGEQSSAGQAPADFFDPGQGSFFDLPAGNVSITGVSASD